MPGAVGLIRKDHCAKSLADWPENSHEPWQLVEQVKISSRTINLDPVNGRKKRRRPHQRGRQMENPSR
jgi:hypothetical protein